MKCAVPPAVATNSNMTAFATAAVLRRLMTLVREQGGALAS
ncbi:hypothetical protein [Rhizobium laguerreae]|nr:hypothetical protein [Rhizobium laguerreae]